MKVGTMIFFFHMVCKGGGWKRKLVDGLVELSWYLPGGNKGQAFEHEICFANLRGDARMFEKQNAILTEISSVILMLIGPEINETEEYLCEVVEKTKTKRPVLIIEKSSTKFKKKFTHKCTVIESSNMKNNDQFFTEIRSKIQDQLKRTPNHPTSFKSISKLGEVAKKHEIIIDSENLSWKKMNKLYPKVTKYLNVGAQEVKKNLKLQLHLGKIAKLHRAKQFRMTSRGGKPVAVNNEDLNNKIHKERESQREILREIDV